MRVLLLSLFFVVSFAANSFAISTAFLHTAAGDCPSCSDYNSYLFCWDGGYPNDTDEAYFASGVSSKDGTVNNVDIGFAYGMVGCIGMLLNADADYVRWAIVARDGFDEAVFTVHIWIKPISSAGVGNDTIFNAKDDADNQLLISLKDDNTVYALYKGQTNAVECTSSNTTTDGEWQFIKVSGSVAGNVLSINVDGQGWEDDVDATAMTAFAASADFAQLGNSVTNIDDSHHVTFGMVTNGLKD